MKIVLYLFFIPLMLMAADNRVTLNLILNHADKMATKIIFSALNTTGQRTTIKKFERDNETLVMEMELQSSRPFEAKYFGEIVKENGLVITKGAFKNNKWNMELDASNARWILSEITPDEGAQMEKGVTPSWFIVDKARAINIEAPYGGKWYPDVAVLDANMEVLSSLREFKYRENLTFSLPEGAMYLKVSSTNGMKLLKEGMWIEHAE